MSLLPPNLIAFIAIARQGTVHGAARELHLTQTGVTQRIRSLEKELGITLFLRSRKGMQLTQEGEALLRYCKGAEDLEGIVQSQLFGGGKNHPIEVTIAGPTSRMTARVAMQCAPLYAKWPQLYLHLKICDAPDRLHLVRSGQTSLAIVSPQQVPNEMDSKKLTPDQYVLVASPKWKGRTLCDLLENERVIDFDERDLTTLNYLKKFQLLAQLKKPRLYLNNNEAIIQFFIQGIGFGTLTTEVVQPYLETDALIVLHKGAILEDPLALVWYPRPEMPPYFRAIVNAIQ